MKKTMRLYLDTSVFGGVFDKEFEKESKRIFHYLNQRKAVLIVSPLVLAEIQKAPEFVQQQLASISNVEFIMDTRAAEDLAKKYLAKKVVLPKSKDDALHVAIATVCRADAIVSWNFKHIVRLDKIKGFNQVNFENGYREIVILCPKEVMFYD